MKEQVKDMFAQVTMPQKTEEAILRAMEEKRKSQRSMPVKPGRKIAAIAAMLALVLVISPTARAAVEGWVLKYVFPESGLSIYEETDADGNLSSVVAVDTESKTFAEFRDGRLYYTCDGEETDITDQIAEDKPFYHSYVDAYGLTHYRAVGYADSLENFGIYEFIRKVEDGQQDWEGWEGGSGRNFLSTETECRYPWVDIVWEDLNVPWPKPEGQGDRTDQ